MSIAAILVAIVVAFLIWRFVVGMVKFVLIAVVLVVGALIATGAIAL